jgi:hypothetical protein
MARASAPSVKVEYDRSCGIDAHPATGVRMRASRPRSQNAHHRRRGQSRRQALEDEMIVVRSIEPSGASAGGDDTLKLVNGSSTRQLRRSGSRMLKHGE